MKKPYAGKSTRAINVKRALELKGFGYNQAEIGKIMAEEEFRPLCYQGDSVRHALRRFRKLKRKGVATNITPHVSKTVSVNPSRGRSGVKR